MTRRFLLLNGLAVIGAVINHALGWGFTSLFWWTDRYEAVTVPDFSQLGSPTYYVLRVLEQIVTVSVPAFLFVSGFFLAFAAGRNASKMGWGIVGSRLRMLLIPYLLWSLAILVGRSLDGSPQTWSGYLERLLFGGAAEPYYYIPVITQLYLLAPLVIPRLRDQWKPVLIVALAVQLAIQAARYPVLLGWDVPAANWIWRHAPGWFFPHMAFWFVLGGYAALHLAEFKETLARWRPILPWATLVLTILAIVEWELLQRFSERQWVAPIPTSLDTLYSLSFLLTFMAYAESIAPRFHSLDALGVKSFGVYLIHAPLLELLSRAMYHATPFLLAHQLVFLTLLTIAGLAVPLMLMTIVSRTPARPYYNYLFG